MATNSMKFVEVTKGAGRDAAVDYFAPLVQLMRGLHKRWITLRLASSDRTTADRELNVDAQIRIARSSVKFLEDLKQPRIESAVQAERARNSSLRGELFEDLLVIEFEIAQAAGKMGRAEFRQSMVGAASHEAPLLPSKRIPTAVFEEFDHAIKLFAKQGIPTAQNTQLLSAIGCVLELGLRPSNDQAR